MKRMFPFFCLLTLLLLLATSAHGASKYWDFNGTTAGSGQGTTTGTWGGTTVTRWNTDSAGVAGTLSTWTLAGSGDSAYFSAGTDATSAFIVTVGANATVGHVTFEEGTVTVKSQTAGGGNIMNILLDPTIFTVNSGANGIWQTGSGNVGISVTKRGTGTLTINTENGWGDAVAGKVLTIEAGTVATPNLAYTVGSHHTLGRMPQITLGSASTPGTLLYTGAAATWGTHGTYHTAINIAAGGGEIRSTVATLTIGAAGGTVGIIKGTAGGDLTFSGGTDFRLNTVATYDGDTIIVSGTTLRSGQQDVLPFGVGKGNVIVNGVFNTVAGSVICTINGLSGSGTVIGAANPFQVGNNNATTTFSGNLGGGPAALNLVKVGTGTLTLTGVNSLTGNTTVSAGKLVGKTGGSSASSAVSVAAAGTHEVNIATANGTWSCASLTYSAGGAKQSFAFDVTPSTTTAPLQVSGALTFTATPTITVSTPAALGDGTYPLIQYGSTSGTAPTTATVTPTPSGAVSVTTESGTVSLVINSAVDRVKADNATALNMGWRRSARRDRVGDL